MEDSRPVATSVGWARLGWDLTELILSYLPLTSLARAAAVCRLWRSVLSQPSFPARAASARRRRPWIFLHGLNHVLPGRNQSFAFDPEAARWFPLPPAPPLLFSGSGGFSFSSDPSGCILFAPIPVSHPWRASPTLSSPRCNPLVAVIGDTSSPRFVVVGGARYVGGLVDIEADRLDAELYDPATSEVWEPCPPLPPEFRPGLSSQWLTSALLHGRLLFVSGIYSGLVSCLDLGPGSRRAWSPAFTLRPPGVLFAFLLAGRHHLLLAGLCSSPGVAPAFVVWVVDPLTMEPREISTMPPALLSCLFEGDDEDSRFSSFKCVGLDGLVYVFNEDHHKAYPTCVCEVEEGGESCSWRKLPPLPGPLNQFRKVVGFCSNVPLTSVVGTGIGDQE